MPAAHEVPLARFCEGGWLAVLAGTCGPGLVKSGCCSSMARISARTLLAGLPQFLPEVGIPLC